MHSWGMLLAEATCESELEDTRGENGQNSSEDDQHRVKNISNNCVNATDTQVADIMTTTPHKSLQGPGGTLFLQLGLEERAVFPVSYLLGWCMASWGQFWCHEQLEL